MLPPPLPHCGNATCTAVECCGPAGVCSPSLCGAGTALKVSARPCLGTKCFAEECCEEVPQDAGGAPTGNVVILIILILITCSVAGYFVYLVRSHRRRGQRKAAPVQFFEYEDGPPPFKPRDAWDAAPAWEMPHAMT